MKAFLILALISTNVFAASNPFCANPVKFTCSGPVDEGKVREENIAKIEDQIKTSAFNKLKRQSNQDLSEIKNYDDLDYISPKRLKKTIQKQFYSLVRVEFAKYLKDNSMPSDIGFTQIKSTLAEVIKKDSTIDEASKGAILDILSSTRLVSLHSVVDDTSFDDVVAIYKNCSKKSFVDNAFATEIHNQKVVVVCPGEIIGTVEFIKEKKINPKFSFYPLVVTLGHELSHHFDYRTYPELYAPILKDVESHSSKLEHSPGGYMSEITADVWGLKVLKKFSASIANNAVYSTLLSGNMNDLCGTDDDSEHPSGDFRIGYLAEKYLCK